jgi:hypothetical protein
MPNKRTLPSPRSFDEWKAMPVIETDDEIKRIGNYLVSGSIKIIDVQDTMSSGRNYRMLVRMPDGTERRCGLIVRDGKKLNQQRTLDKILTNAPNEGIDGVIGMICSTTGNTTIGYLKIERLEVAVEASKILEFQLY